MNDKNDVFALGDDEPVQNEEVELQPVIYADSELDARHYQPTSLSRQTYIRIACWTFAVFMVFAIIAKVFILSGVGLIVRF